MSRAMVVHCYEEGCGFNATIPGTKEWRSRYPMNAWELRRFVERQQPVDITFSGDVRSAQEALAA